MLYQGAIIGTGGGGINLRLGEMDGNSQNEAMPAKVYLLSVLPSLTTGDRQSMEEGEPEARPQLGIRPESWTGTEAILYLPRLYPFLKWKIIFPLGLVLCR
jgi:hypothetical protein